jgi:catechol 2,3-dioxygenase-like lactoylglutathione lyase family enzyme
MIETKGVVHFTIPVSDHEKSEVFYREVLGLETVQVVPPIGMVFMRSGDDFVILTRSKTPVDPNPGNEFFVHHAFRVDVDKYEASKQHLVDHGVEIIFEEERHEGMFHGKQCYFHDPDRNVLEIIGLEKIGDGFAPEKLDDDFSPFSSGPEKAC